MAYDLLIKNGRIVDGSGSPAREGSVAVQGGKIAGVGKVSGEAKRVIDARGTVIAPGFIDIHTHYDAQVLWDPLFTSSCWNGVTSVVMSNCGLSLVPCKPQDRDYMLKMLARVEGISLSAMENGFSWDFASFDDYLSRIGKKLGLNVAAQVGHNAVRRFVMGEDANKREATPEEVARMKVEVRKGLEAGAVGFTISKGRPHIDWEGKPVPSRLAAFSETLELARALGEFGFGAIEVLPGEPGCTDQDREEMFRLAKETGRYLSWNEISQNNAQPGRWKQNLEFMNRAVKEGARVYGVCSCRPTTQDWDFLDNNIVLTIDPVWLGVLTKPLKERMPVLKDTAWREKSRPVITESWEKLKRWDTTLVANPRTPQNQQYKGITLRELGKRAGKPPFDAMMDLALSEDLRTEFMFGPTRNTDSAAIAEIMRDHTSILGISDAGAHLNMFPGARYSTDVLGTWVREKKVLTLEQAVQKMTLQPATHMGFTDRGLLKTGMAADITVFDPDVVQVHPKQKVHDLPHGEERYIIKAQGIEHTIVNGTPLMERGEHTGAFPGKVIRSTDYVKKR